MGRVAPPGRIRLRGAGRKKLAGTDPALAPARLALVADSSRGDPKSPLLWTTKSVKKLAGELTAAGHRCSPQTAWRRLHEEGFSTQANARVAQGGGTRTGTPSSGTSRRRPGSTWPRGSR